MRGLSLPQALAVSYLALMVCRECETYSGSGCERGHAVPYHSGDDVAHQELRSIRLHVPGVHVDQPMGRAWRMKEVWIEPNIDFMCNVQVGNVEEANECSKGDKARRAPSMTTTCSDPSGPAHKDMYILLLRICNNVRRSS